MGSLSNRIFNGALWMLLTRLLIKSIGIVSSIILARVLSPEDFGLVAIVMAIYAFIELFGVSGFNVALIQKKSATKDDYNTVWTISFLFGLVAALIFVFVAPYIANFFNDIRLENATYAIACMFFLSGLKNVGVVDFQKNLEFNLELKFQFIPKILSFIFTISLLFYVANYWTLIAGMLFNQLLIVIFSYIMHPFRPRFSLKGFASLFKFSKWLIINNVLTYLNTKAVDLIIGKMVNTKAAGLYNISQEIAGLPVSEIVAPINKSSFPGYCQVKDQLAKLRELYYETVSLISVLIIPAAIGLFSVADLMVPVVLGDKWLEATPIIQYIAISGLFLGLTTNNGYMFLAIGKPHISTVSAAMRVFVMLTSIVTLTSINGTIGAAQGMLFAAVIGLFISYIFLFAFIKVEFKSILKSLYRPLVSASYMWASLHFISSLAPLNAPWALLILKICCGAVVYLAVLLLLWWLRGCPDSVEKQIVEKIYRKA